MNKRIVFKVVTKGTDDIFHSANIRGIREEFLLTYEIGKTTVPKIGRIFVFDTYENAREFMRKYVGNVIFKGIATDTGVPKLISKLQENLLYKEEFAINYFWKTKSSKRKLIIGCKSAPTGTLSCSSFTPTEIVY